MSRPQVRVGLVGAGIQKSRSPAMHRDEAAALGLDLGYALFDLDLRVGGPEALPDILAHAEAAGFAGLNVTHPCKQQVIPLLDELSEDARALGAVNTVVFRDGRRIGHNTDWSGFLQSFRRGLPDVGLGTVLQLGAGGAGAAVAYAALRLGVGRLLLHDVDTTRARDLAARLDTQAGRDFASPTGDLAAAMAAADGLVNATPVGMEAHPGMPLPSELLTARHWVGEIVYVPMETTLLTAARAKGCAVLDGGGMAVFQAAAAFRLFTGITPDAERMLARFRASPA